VTRPIPILGILALAALLTACGGGSETSGTASADDLGSSSQGSALSAQLCGIGVGPQLLQGTVTAVHDGDTLTLDGQHKVRLDSIDAPELAQAYGGTAQAALSSAVLGQTVRVAYSKTDRYGRIVGAVFTSSCQYVNLNQVASGAAWFYKAYQCEVNATTRALFAAAQATAVAAPLGLWTSPGAVAPWVYRNGTDPAVPVCSDTSPATTTTTTTTTTAATGCYQVWVNGYTRANGTVVQGYYRDSPGCA
jgi:endonuclease YncB( thermonuclease family)